MTTHLAPTRVGLASLFERLAPARARLGARDDQLIATQIALCEIASPTGAEGERGASVLARFRRLGLADVRVDDVGNVIGVRPGEDSFAEPVVVCAHLDTVFPNGTPVEVQQNGMHLCGPSIVDNSRGLAVMLALAEAIDGRMVATRRPIIFAATVGEEGCGDLRGAKHLFASMERLPSSCIAIDGAGDERVVTKALGSRRFQITCRGVGGHSWSSFGIANPVHAAGATIAKLATIGLPRAPRTTLSVCKMGGGISINSIPADAWIQVDLRSSSADVIQSCALEIERAARAAVREENSRSNSSSEPLEFSIEVIGDRPCGELDARHPLVDAAMFATTAIGRIPDVGLASTDANVPISLGIPAIAIGAGGRGGAVHTTSEWYDNTDGPLGVARALTIVVAAAEL